jgi:hypothetical protein
MPNPTVFNENLADIEFFCLHEMLLISNVIIFLIRHKLSGRTGAFNDKNGI